MLTPMLENSNKEPKKTFLCIAMMGSNGCSRCLQVSSETISVKNVVLFAVVFAVAKERRVSSRRIDLLATHRHESNYSFTSAASLLQAACKASEISLTRIGLVQSILMCLLEDEMRTILFPLLDCLSLTATIS